MNISKEIAEYAEKLELDWIATGGGCDFIAKENIGPHYQSQIDCWLIAQEGPDGPDTLDEPSILSIRFGDNMDQMVDLFFATAREAMDAMTTIKFASTCNID